MIVATLCIVTQMARLLSSSRAMSVSAYLCGGAYGMFWGMWGASVPRVQEQAAIDDGQLGVALLFIGAGALPPMVLAGRALDRWGLGLAGATLAAMGCAGIVLAVTADDLVRLCVGLSILGATSGSADVGLNAVAGRAEQTHGRPLVARTHAAFSALVVVGSLGTGAASAALSPVAVPFIAVGLLCMVVGAFVFTTLPGVGDVAKQDRVAVSPVAVSRSVATGRWRAWPFVLIGTLGALAFASENAQQSWSAVFAERELDSGAGLSAVAPAVFASAVAISRLAISGLEPVHARTVLLVGALTAAGGAGLIAVAPNLPVAAAGLATTAAGTGVLYPTLVSIASRHVHESHRGRATSVVTIVSYSGFILGPVYVGVWADLLGLRAAMVAVAALGLGLFALTPLLLLRSGFDDRGGEPLDGPDATEP